MQEVQLTKIKMQKFSSKLLRKVELTHDVWHFDFGFGEAKVDFEAGQFFMLEVPGPERPVGRAFSLASGPNQKDFFSLCVKLIPGGLASEFLKGMEVGALANFQAPFGHFVLRNLQKDLIFVATGTGVAPFMGMIPSLFEMGFSKQATLYFGVRAEEDLFYVEVLKAWEKKHPNFKVIFTLSRPHEGWVGEKGRVTEHMERLEIDTLSSQVYICGNGDMVKEVKNVMESKGLSKTDIHFEQYTPVSPVQK